MSNFQAILKTLTESKEVIEEAKDDLGGVVVNGKVIKVPEPDRKRVKKVIDKYKAANASAGDKALFRLAGMAVKMKNVEAGDIIKAFELATSDAYRDFLKIEKAPVEKE